MGMPLMTDWMLGDVIDLYKKASKILNLNLPASTDGHTNSSTIPFIATLQITPIYYIIY